MSQIENEFDAIKPSEKGEIVHKDQLPEPKKSKKSLIDEFF